MKKKGQFGYQRNRRIFSTIWFALLLGADCFMFFYSRHYFGTTRNLFTIFFVLVCLPVGMLGVSAIMHFRAKGCSPRAHREIERHVGILPGLYDLYLTSYNKNFQLSHLCAAQGCIAALTESSSCDLKAGEEHIRTMLRNNGWKNYQVKIFTSLPKYCERLDSLNALSRGAEPEELTALMALMKTLSI